MSNDTIKLAGTVIVTEISGSESIVHTHIGGGTCVSQNSGIFPLEIGKQVEFFIQTNRCLIFDKDNVLVKSWQQ